MFIIVLGQHVSIFISVTNQLDAQHFCFTISLFHASTCFEHMFSKHVEAWNKLIVKQNFCASSWLITDINHQEVNIVLHSLWYHHTYRCDDTRGCVMQCWPPDDEHMFSKHVEAWNKLIVKQNFCASSWLITDINHQEVNIVLHSLWYHHTYRCDDTRGCVMQCWPPDDGHMCSKHVEARNKLIVKQKCCASCWLITEINILRCTVSETSKFVSTL